MIWELAPKLTVIFRHQVRRGSFPTCWRLADVVPVSKESASLKVGEYRPTSIRPVLSNIFEKNVARKLSHFLEDNRLFPLSQFSYRKGLGTFDALLTLS